MDKKVFCKSFKDMAEESNIELKDDEAEIIDLINDAKEYLVRNFNIIEENLNKLAHKKFYVPELFRMKDHGQVISGILEDIKNLFILNVRGILYSPTCSQTGMVADLRSTITSIINDNIIGGILVTSTTYYRSDREEIRKDVDYAISVSEEVRSELLKRVDKLGSLFERN